MWKHHSEQHEKVHYDAAIETADLPPKVLQTTAGYEHKIAEYLFEISCLDGISDWMRERTIPSQFFRFFQKALDLYDESIQYLLGHLRRQGFSTECEPGCTYCCCHMPTGISAPELLYLYHGMHQSGFFPKFLRRCLEAEEQWRETMKNNVLMPQSEAQTASIREKTLMSYQRLEHHCPFLQQHLCQVYPYRPLACRMHFSLSPPYWCSPSHFQHDYAVRFNLEPGERVYEALEHIEDRMQVRISDIMVGGLLELTVNLMQCEKISWIN